MTSLVVRMRLLNLGRFDVSIAHSKCRTLFLLFKESLGFLIFRTILLSTAPFCCYILVEFLGVPGMKLRVGCIGSLKSLKFHIFIGGQLHIFSVRKESWWGSPNCGGSLEVRFSHLPNRLGWCGAILRGFFLFMIWYGTLSLEFEV